MMQYHSFPLQAKTFGVILMAVVITTAVGCGNKAPYSYVKVSGKVTFEDGKPIKAGEIKVLFLPQNVSTSSGPKPHSGIAAVNVEDGTFDVVTSYRYGDGILPGEHRVLIMASGSQSQSEMVPPEYSDPDKTPLAINAADAPFHFKIKRLR